MQERTGRREDHRCSQDRSRGNAGSSPRRGGHRRLQALVNDRGIDDGDGLSVELQWRNAIVLAGEKVSGRVAERVAVQEPEQVTVAREVVADHGEPVGGSGSEPRERAPPWAVQHVVAVEPEVPDAVFPGHGQALHRVDLVVQQVETADVR